MANVCPSLAKFCTTRATRLDPVTGGVVGVADNSYVTDSPITLQMTPEITEGTESELKNGCGQVVASSKTPDRFKRWNLVLTMSKFEPGFIEMLTGDEVAVDGAGDPIGIIGQDQFSDAFVQAKAALEGWMQAIIGDAQDPARPWVYVVLPATTWTLGEETLQEEFTPWVLNGNSQTNSGWSNGPYGDTGFDDVVSTWAIATVESDPPVAACGYATVAATS